MFYVEDAKGLIKLVNAFEHDEHTDQIISTVVRKPELFAALIPDETALSSIKKGINPCFHGMLDDAAAAHPPRPE